jgi:hypothetical protein
MARYSDLRERLSADEARLEAQLKDAKPGPYRDKLEPKLGQISAAYSPGLRTPE